METNVNHWTKSTKKKQEKKGRNNYQIAKCWCYTPNCETITIDLIKLHTARIDAAILHVSYRPPLYRRTTRVSLQSDVVAPHPSNVVHASIVTTPSMNYHEMTMIIFSVHYHHHHVLLFFFRCCCCYHKKTMKKTICTDEDQKEEEEAGSVVLFCYCSCCDLTTAVGDYLLLYYSFMSQEIKKKIISKILKKIGKFYNIKLNKIKIEQTKCLRFSGTTGRSPLLSIRENLWYKHSKTPYPLMTGDGDR